jgi:ABC-type sugar transport system ATPase subunit
MEMSSEILVSRQGRIVEEFAGNVATEETIMDAAIH